MRRPGVYKRITEDRNRLAEFDVSYATAPIAQTSAATEAYPHLGRWHSSGRRVAWQLAALPAAGTVSCPVCLYPSAHCRDLHCVVASERHDATNSVQSPATRTGSAPLCR